MTATQKVTTDMVYALLLELRAEVRGFHERMADNNRRIDARLQQIEDSDYELSKWKEDRACFESSTSTTVKILAAAIPISIAAASFLSDLILKSH